MEKITGDVLHERSLTFHISPEGPVTTFRLNITRSKKKRQKERKKNEAYAWMNCSH